MQPLGNNLLVPFQFAFAGYSPLLDDIAAGWAELRTVRLFLECRTRGVISAVRIRQSRDHRNVIVVKIMSTEKIFGQRCVFAVGVAARQQIASLHIRCHHTQAGPSRRRRAASGSATASCSATTTAATASSSATAFPGCNGVSLKCL